jgi:hypothetical protein
MTGFSPGYEKLVLWPSYVRVMRTRNVTQLQSGKYNPYHDRVTVGLRKTLNVAGSQFGCSGKRKSHDFIVPCGKLP